MAKNISLMGADYPDVPAVQLPQTGGGTATFYDINVIDNLNSDSSTDALSAKQGKLLNTNKADKSTLNTYGSGNGVTAGAKFTIDGARVQKIGYLCFVFVIATANSAFDMSDVICTLGNDFRPNEQATVMSVYHTMNNTRYAYAGYGTIETNGSIKQAITNKGAAGQVFEMTFIYRTTEV